MNDLLITTLISVVSAVFVSVIGFLISYRLLKSEYLGKHRMELISKQMVACEKLWVDLSVASKSKQKSNLIANQKNALYLDGKITEALYSNIITTINSPSGLYFSRHLRKSVFDLRDFIEQEIYIDLNNQDQPISITKAKKLDGYIQNVRIAIRKELKIEDLKASQEGPL
ncbi:MAG: hypothetical protein QY328_00225 [Anaerolineales bacterium]|nr:MAG: hypothetical protein QY328_00225 [Anaerolineales bacterium]